MPKSSSETTPEPKLPVNIGKQVRQSDNSQQVPAIAEVLCELHFDLSKESQKQAWDPKWFGKMLQELGVNYDLEPANFKLMHVNSAPGKTVEIHENPVDRMIYRHKTDSYLFQLSPGLLAINQLGDYPGWTVFLERIEEAWKTFSKVVGTSEINRIGLRYINRIPRSEENALIGYWLSKNEWLPSGLLGQTKDFFFKFDAKIKNDLHFKLTIIEEQTPQKIAPLIFDLDAIHFNRSLKHWLEVSKDIGELHKILRKKFDQSLTQNYQKFISADRNNELNDS